MTEPTPGPERDGERRPAGRDPASGVDASLSDRLQRLNTALDKARPKGQAQAQNSPDRTSTSSGMALAFRLGAEFISAVLVGALIGWGIDTFFGVAPLMMIVFMLIGFAAGALNMLRAAGETGGRGGRPKG